MKVGHPAIGSIMALITPLLAGVGCGEEPSNRTSERSMADAAVATDESAQSPQGAPAADPPSAAADQPSPDALAPNARDAEAAVASSGQGIKCSVTTWAGPSAPRVDAVCGVRRSDEALGESAPYFCHCDTSVCALDPTERLPSAPCASRVTAASCAEALMAHCKESPGKAGFCEAWDGRGAKVCWTQQDGTHSCRCGDEAELVASPLSDCDQALAGCGYVERPATPRDAGANPVSDAGRDRPGRP